MALSSDSGPRSSAEPSRTEHFRETILCHVELLYRVAARMTGNHAEAEDVVQDTLLRAHQAFDRFELREHGAAAWLLKIMHNHIQSLRRRAGHEPDVRADGNLDAFAAEPHRGESASASEDPLDWDQLDDELKAAVSELEPEYRDVLLLWALGDLKYREIAAVLDVPLGTVESRLHRAREKLSRQLKEYAARRGMRTGGRK